MYRLETSKRRIPVTVSLPLSLLERLDRRLKTTETRTRSEYVRNVLEQVLAEDDQKVR